jgi:divalent metal cation (Fe/Co/Zn/Cd) transporter
VVTLTGLLVFDPLMAPIVALHILWSGSKVVRGSVDSLMDRAVDGSMEETIRSVISKEATDALEVHDLRTRGAGRIASYSLNFILSFLLR